MLMTFFDETFLGNYAGDTAFYSISKSHFLNQFVLKKTFMYLQKWYHDNGMVLNPRKCYYYMTFGVNTTKNKFVAIATMLQLFFL